MEQRKKLYLDTVETITVEKRVRLSVEVDAAFTQVYHSYSLLSRNLKSINSHNIMVWLLANSQEPSIPANNLLERFNKDMVSTNNKAIARSVFFRSLKELTEVGLLYKNKRSEYVLNPFVFWKGDQRDRASLIKEVGHLFEIPRRLGTVEIVDSKTEVK